MWSDTDPAGIVWFGVFFRYFENAEEDLYPAPRQRSHRAAARAEASSCRARRCSRGSDRRPSSATSCRSASASPRSPIGASAFAFDIHERGTDRLICEASYRVACVDADDVRAADISDEIVALLTPAPDVMTARHRRIARHPGDVQRRDAISSIARRRRARRATSRSNAATSASPTTTCCATSTAAAPRCATSSACGRKSASCCCSSTARSSSTLSSARSRSARCRCR